MGGARAGTPGGAGVGGAGRSGEGRSLRLTGAHGPVRRVPQRGGSRGSADRFARVARAAQGQGEAWVQPKGGDGGGRRGACDQLHPSSPRSVQSAHSGLWALACCLRPLLLEAFSSPAARAQGASRKG